VEALQAIYDEEMVVLSPVFPPTVDAAEVSLAFKLAVGGDDGNHTVDIRAHLPAGYPVVASRLSVFALAGASTSDRDQISSHLLAKAEELKGNEAIMELLQECIERCEELISNRTQSNIEQSTSSNHAVDDSRLQRCYIWVHHVTDNNRKKAIVEEARSLGLRGCLKAGYPGVVVIEGPSSAAQDFIIWIKGNKSRPGGFGRNWGHHVRGQIEIDDFVFPDSSFEAIEEDMSALGKCCPVGEFREFVLQHGGNQTKT